MALANSSGKGKFSPRHLLAQGPDHAVPGGIASKHHAGPLYLLRWRLIILFFPLAGPFLAPLFTWIGIWPFTIIARFVYFLGDILCPLPGRSLYISGYSTAVCPLCYGALVGLALILLGFPFRPPVRRLWECIPWPLQLILITFTLIPWLGNYVANKSGWVSTPSWAMYVLGFAGGLAIGLLTYFVLGGEAADAPSVDGQGSA
jgi:uncharacterized membrane protein